MASILVETSMILIIIQRSRYLLALVLICTLQPINSYAQTSRSVNAEIKDSIVAMYNRNDFNGIYQMADSSFSKRISLEKLCDFLRNNRNSGNILSTSAETDINGKISYILSCETRDIKMTLQVNDAKKFTAFGFNNVPPNLLTALPSVQNNNLKTSVLDKIIDSIVLNYFRNPNASGISIGIITNGHTKTYHYGVTNKQTKSLPGNRTVYEIGSVTKTFTTTILAHAILENKLSPDDDIRKFFDGDFPNLSYEGKPIRIRDLANHTSGLPSLPDDIEKQKDFNPLIPEKNYDPAMYYAALRRVQLDTLPGYKYNYSNWGISILGMVLEKIYKKPLPLLTRKYITGPLAMKQTSFTMKTRKQKHYAVPYTDNGKPGYPGNEGIFFAAGGLRASLNDMIRYLVLQIEESDPAVRLTHQPTVGNVGLGWGVRNNGSYRDLQHNGSTIGFLTHISVFPELNSGLVILANSKADIGPVIRRLHQVIIR